MKAVVLSAAGLFAVTEGFGNFNFDLLGRDKNETDKKFDLDGLKFGSGDGLKFEGFSGLFGGDKKNSTGGLFDKDKESKTGKADTVCRLSVADCGLDLTQFTSLVNTTITGGAQPADASYIFDLTVEACPVFQEYFEAFYYTLVGNQVEEGTTKALVEQGGFDRSISKTTSANQEYCAQVIGQPVSDSGDMFGFAASTNDVLKDFDAAIVDGNATFTFTLQDCPDNVDEMDIDVEAFCVNYDSQVGNQLSFLTSLTEVADPVVTFEQDPHGETYKTKTVDAVVGVNFDATALCPLPTTAFVVVKGCCGIAAQLLVVDAVFVL
mmetsp:Transcript_17251/g.35006  ORF Transcript_17251/g.35006 Transcript_17251/m.35006 type:complete len:322 (-) Transcript_17251:1371-2336(-)